MFYAHSTSQPDRKNWEPYEEHWYAVMMLAACFAAKFGFRRAAEILAEFHDLGKLTQAFQDYIAGKQRRGPDHSTAGAKHLMELDLSPFDKLMAEILAYAIAGHHAGLPDKTGAEGGTLRERLARTDLPPLDPDWRRFHTEDPSGLWSSTFKGDRENGAFQLAFLGRMLFSCLVDADSLATEAFYARTEGRVVERDWPHLPEIVDRLIAAVDADIAKKSAVEPKTEQAAFLQRTRQAVLAQVVAQADAAPGVFTLDVPTGGGKTLTSLAFALRHAKAQGLDRIIYAIPFTSVIDQTAETFRDILGDGVVLEHHSAIESADRSEEGDAPEAQNAEAKRRLAAENWDAPIVVTTNVQLFESLFAHRRSRCRKLHNIARSIIILDECQTIPLHVLRPAIAALKELQRNYGCSIVLCTATQPALLEPDFKGGFAQVRALVPDAKALHSTLRRVTPHVRGEMSDEDLVAELGAVEQGLVIVNGRRHALALYQLARDSLGEDGLVHLTTRQTLADRQVILAKLKRRLKVGERCRVIATSLIEAGIDISFPRAWRAEAGLDQIIQAAGRVNREWEAAPEASFVTIFKPAEAKPPVEIEAFADAMRRVAEQHAADLFGQAAIKTYFLEVYWRKAAELDLTVMDSLNGRKPQAVLDQFRVSRGETDFAYRTVGEAFRLIKDGMEPVIIAHDEKAKDALAALRGGLPAGAAARRLQPYIVQVPPHYRRLLVTHQNAQFVKGFDDQFLELTNPNLYKTATGLVWEEADRVELTDSII